MEFKYITTSELLSKGISYFNISKMVEEGSLIRRNKSLYENTYYEGDENDFIDVNAYIPNGVIALLSAARYYGLSTFLPDAAEVALNRKSKVSTMPQRPAVKILYYSKKRMGLGLTNVMILEKKIPIFGIEKTVADVLSFRDKVGIEEATEVLKSYLHRPNRNLKKLYSLLLFH